MQRTSWRFRLLRMLKGGTSPHDLGLGFAVGAFIGIMPGMGTPAAIIVALIFRLNKAAAALGSLISNPFTVGFLYAGGLQLGNWILQIENTIHWDTVWSFQPGWWNELTKAIPPFLIGLVPMGLVISAIFYGLVRWAAVRYQQRRHHRRSLRPARAHPPRATPHHPH